MKMHAHAKLGSLYASRTQEDHLIFEYAHVLMLTLAIMHAKEISIKSILSTRIEVGFACRIRFKEEGGVLAAEREWAARSDQLGGMSRLWSRSTFLNRQLNRCARALLPWLAST